MRYWYEQVAVLSGSYIYFYPADKLECIEEVVSAMQKQPLLKRS